MRFILLLLLLTGCSQKSSDEYNTAETEKEVVVLFNKREYHKAAWLIESKNGSNPKDPKITFLLAQAYLGKAGFEPLDFMSRVSDKQPFSNDGFFPACGNEALKSVKTATMKCLFKRVHEQAPDPDEANFSHARDLFRKAYPSPKLAPDWVNTLVGLVECTSFSARLGNLMAYARKLRWQSQLALDQEWLKRQGKGSLAEASQCLARAEYSNIKISNFLSGMKNKIWFQVRNNEMKFTEDLNLDDLILSIVEAVQRENDPQALNKLIQDINQFLDDQEKKP